MIVFTISCSESKKEILDKFSKYEDDVPSAFDPLAEYFDSRVGFHVKIGERGIKGYYEDGKLESRGKLMKGKNFFWIRVREINEGSKIKVLITFAPFLFLIILLSNLAALLFLDNEMVYVIIEVIFLFLLLRDKIWKEQLEIKELIERISQD